MSAPRRNIVLILTDQQRAAGAYEAPGMRTFRTKLRGFQRLCARGVHYTQHRITSAACAPSRASLFTGYSAWVHGVTQTDGFAKRPDDPAQVWLSPNHLPTLGHRFQAAGWKTVYFGKWHLSHADLDIKKKEAHTKPEERYLEAQPLKEFGFENWIGPEPHGASIKNAGIFRDETYVQQACAFLRQYDAATSSKQPFLMVLSLVNPHDIVFWPAWGLWKRAYLDLDGIPEIEAGPSDTVIPASEPDALRAYRKQYYAAYAPRSIVNMIYRHNQARYRRFYASLIRRADRHIETLLDTLQTCEVAQETDIVFTSDHGELLGSHGSLHQKWYNAYEETLRVPLVIAQADAQERHGTVCDDATDHEDITPTLLSMAGIDETLPLGWRERFASAPTLRGRDVRNTVADCTSYFVTFDNILSGQSPHAAFGRRFPWVGAIWPMRYTDLGIKNHAVEAVVVHRKQMDTHTGIWKLIRYFDPHAPAVNPSNQWMLFNLTQDPAERDNVIGKREYEKVLVHLRDTLESERKRRG